MKKKIDDKTFYLHIVKYVFISLLIPGLFMSCDKITGSDDDDKKPTTEPQPEPDPETNPADITSFTASDYLVAAGETVTLSWEISGNEPITLTLEPLGIDVTGETSTEVTPEENTTYRLIAENDGGNDEEELVIEVIVGGETAIEVTITGLPGNAKANVAITDHNSFMQWVSSNSALTGITPETYTVASSGVEAAGSVYIPDQGIQMIPVSNGEVVNVQVHYSMASGNIYVSEPDVGSCDAGELTAEAKERSRMSINFIRALLGLPMVGYNSSSDKLVQEASLIAAANAELNHFPPESWHCYSEDGADGSETSNLGIALGNTALDFTPESFTTLWTDDFNVPSLGHRRWLIDPLLEDISFGFVEGAPIDGEYANVTGSAVRVVWGYEANINGLSLPFVAYPRGDFPSNLFTNDWFLSFSVIANTDGRYSNDDEVDYGSADITMEDNNGNVLAITEIMIDHTPYGLPNSIQWKAAGMQNGRNYTVSISGVKVNGKTRDFEYDVRLR